MARLFANQPGCAGNFQMPAESRRCAVNQCRLQSKKLKGATISFSNFLPGDDELVDIELVDLEMLSKLAEDRTTSG